MTHGQTLFQAQKNIVLAHVGAQLDIARDLNPHAEFDSLLAIALDCTKEIGLNEAAGLLDSDSTVG